jgi:hypothetical protein
VHVLANTSPIALELTHVSQAVTDAPCVCFSDELIDAYPNAKVILSNRDPDKWLASMETAYYKILCHPDFKWFRALCAIDTVLIDSFLHYIPLTPLQEKLAPYFDLLHMPLLLWTDGDLQNRVKLRETFISHYAHIREIVPKENLLEWEPKDGYEPICKFLGKPIPDEPFPYVNKGDNAAVMHKVVGRIRALQLLTEYFNGLLLRVQ